MENIKELEDLVEIVLEGVKYDDKVSNDVYIYNATQSICKQIVDAANDKFNEVVSAIKTKSRKTFDLGEYELDFPNTPTIFVHAYCCPANDDITQADASNVKKQDGKLSANIRLFYPNAYNDGIKLYKYLHHEIVHVIDSLEHRHKIQTAIDWSGFQKRVTAPKVRRQMSSLIPPEDEDLDDVYAYQYWNQPSEVNARLHGFINGVANILANQGIFNIDMHKLLNGEYGEGVSKEVRHLFHKVVPENRKRIIKRLSSLVDNMNEKLSKLKK